MFKKIRNKVNSMVATAKASQYVLIYSHCFAFHLFRKPTENVGKAFLKSY